MPHRSVSTSMQGMLRGFSMGSIQIRKRLHHHWVDLFQLVAELERYPEFVPCCQRTKVLLRKADGPDKTVIVSRMTVGVSALHVSYANRTTANLPERQIKVQAVDGPLRRLDVTWTFNPDGDTATDVAFSVSYEFSSPMLGILASGMFDTMFRQIMDAFEKRADQLFRRSGRRTRKAAPAGIETAALAASNR
jgi:coenzyme Q-binding protein COQ10